MKNFKKFYSILIIITLVIPLFLGCSSRPEDTVMKFEKAYNKLDVKGMINCLEPTTANAINATISLAGDFFNVDANSLMDLIPVLPKLFNTGSEDTLPKIKINVIDTKMEGDSAVVYTEVTVSESGQKKVYTGEFIMTMVDGEWYISDIR